MSIDFVMWATLGGFLLGYPVAMAGVELCYTKFDLWGRAIICIGIMLPLAGTIILIHWMLYGN